MTPADVWLVGYAAVVVLSGATVLVRREPTLLRGRFVFLFTVSYVAVAWGILAWRGTLIPPHVGIAAAVAIVLAALLAPWWFVLGGPRSAVITTMEVCFGRVCATYQHVDRGFVMTVPGGTLHVRVHALPFGRATVVWFRAAPPHRKSNLLRQLFAKQYRGALPTVRIRF